MSDDFTFEIELSDDEMEVLLRALDSMLAEQAGTTRQLRMAQELKGTLEDTRDNP